MRIELLDYLKRFEFQNERIESFFTTCNSDSQYWMYEMDTFCKRVDKAIINNEKVCIYSDYDADAITATAVMYWGLIALGMNKANLSYYAPDRFTEGYGLNPTAISNLSLINDLIITVDCGINSVVEAQICLANNQSCDMIITDHHVLSGDIPKALAVINPRLTDVYLNDYTKQNYKKSVNSINFPEFPFSTSNKTNWVSSSVCGVGVSWFCVLSLALYRKQDPTLLNSLLPFVAIGTIADCQSILNVQNRTLVKAGMQMFAYASSQYPGLKALLEVSKVMEKVKLNVLSSNDLGYMLAPILNAAGRIDHAHLAISLLCSNNYDESLVMAEKIVNINTLRKQMVKDSVEELATLNIDSTRGCVFVKSNFNKGIVGLIASKLVDKYNLPSIVVSGNDVEGGEDSLISASLRTPKGYNLVDIMSRIPAGILEKFGGHPEAAGFSIKASNIHKAESAFVDIMRQYSKLETTYTNYLGLNMSVIGQEFGEFIQSSVDNCNNRHVLYIRSSDLTDDLMQDIWKLEPFSNDFPIPTFLIRVDGYKVFDLGQGGKHCRIDMGHGSLIAFNINPADKEFLTDGGEFFCTARVSKNVYNSVARNQMIIDKLIIPFKHQS